MSRFSREQIEAIYATHPLRKQTLLRRLLQQRGSLVGLTALDFAEDELTQISDQNHTGGLTFTRQLAERAGISRASVVLDLGCGLGGSARALAWLYGCRVHGLDLSAQRISEAVELTTLVGLEHLVTFACGDAMTTPLPPWRFDVLWGQAAWSHAEDKRGLLRKWSAGLAPAGCVAVEDVCLLRPARGETERRLLASLEDHWTSYLVALDGWRRIVEDSGLAIRVDEDCSQEFRKHLIELRTGADRLDEPVSAFERHAWSLAAEAIEAGLIGYFRIVANVSVRGRTQK
jgi:SAM-dependent methyltransferase